MEKKAVRHSLSEQVYMMIIEKIKQGELKQGDKINIEKFSREFDVSRTPLREAINRLIQNGFLESKHNVGTRVAVYSMTDAREIIEVNAILTRAAMENVLNKPICGEWINSLKNVLMQQQEAYNDDLQFFSMKAIEFHEILIERCDNIRLKELALETLHKIGIWVYQYLESDHEKLQGLNDHRELIRLLENEEKQKFLELMKIHDERPFEFFDK